MRVAGEAVTRRGAQVLEVLLTAVCHGGASEGGAGKAVRAWRRAGEACTRKREGAAGQGQRSGAQ